MNTKRWVVITAVVAVSTACAVRAETLPDADARRLLSAFSAQVDLRVASVSRCLLVLASTDEARSGAWDSISSLLSVYQASDSGLAAWYALADGTYYTAGQGHMDVSLADRDYFPDLLAGRSVMGALVISKSTGNRSAIVAVPVMKDGTMVAAVGASLFLDALSDEISTALDLPDGSGFFALAPDGRTALHSRKDRHFLDPRELGSDSLKQAASRIMDAREGTVTYEYDGVPKQAVFRTTDLMSWHYVIASGMR